MAVLTPTQIEEMGRALYGGWKVAFTKDEAIARALMLTTKATTDYFEFRVEPNTASGIDWLVVGSKLERGEPGRRDYIIEFHGEKWRIAVPLR